MATRRKSQPSSKHAPHLASLVANIKESLTLLKIHEKAAGSGPGRKVGVEVLNKSAIILVVASWEAYVEDTASSALSFMIEAGGRHNVFPNNVLERVANKNQGLNSWKLAGDGWRQALRDNFSEVLSTTTGKLNTPKPAQVDDLFLKTIGLSQMSKNWYWKGRSNTKCIAALEQLIELRGSIAHRVQHANKVWKKDVREAAELIGRLGEKTNNATHAHVVSLVGAAPWSTVKYVGLNK